MRLREGKGKSENYFIGFQIQDMHLRYCQTDLFAQIQNDDEGGIKEK